MSGRNRALLFLLLPGIRLRRVFIFIVRCVLYVCTIAVAVPVFENPLKTMGYGFCARFRNPLFD